jgi:O-antigen/teichoic acid export membrane protein
VDWFKCGPAGKLLAMCGKERLEFWNAALIGIMNLGLNISLIQKYSILGAALATGFSLSVLNLVRVIEIWHIYRITPHQRSHLLIFLPITIMTALVSGIKFVFGSSIATALGSALLTGVIGLLALNIYLKPKIDCC